MPEVFDAYSRRARLYPGGLLTLPITGLLVMLFVSRPAWWTALLTLLGSTGATYMAAEIIRSIGKRDEPAMWQRWGGPPTSVGLRYANARNTAIVDRRHLTLQSVVPGTHMPTQAEEEANPAAAEQVYETVVSVVRARTRDHEKYKLLFLENCSYGFRRNLLACKTYGYIAIGLSAVACAALLLLYLGNHHPVPLPGIFVVLVLDLIVWLVLRLHVTDDWVREAAVTYADRLFEAAEALATN